MTQCELLLPESFPAVGGGLAGAAAAGTGQRRVLESAGLSV